MKTNWHKRFLISASMVVLLGSQISPLQGAIIGVSGGTGAPPASLGPFSLTLFPLDPTAEFTSVNSVASPLGGSVTFSVELLHLLVPLGWQTWSHGYTGDVYANRGINEITLNLPAGTAAFLLFAQPNNFRSFEITAEAQDGTEVTQTVSGTGGAAAYGFYGTDGDLLSKITVTASSVELGIGEFAIASAGPSTEVPDSANTVSLLGLGLISLSLLQRWTKSRSRIVD